MIKTYQPGNAIVLRVVLIDRNQNPSRQVDADSITIDILDPLGNIVIAAQPMVRQGRGTYSYTYSSGINDMVHTEPWLQRVVVQRSGNVNRKLSPSFYLSNNPVV